MHHGSLFLEDLAGQWEPLHTGTEEWVVWIVQCWLVAGWKPEVCSVLGLPRAEFLEGLCAASMSHLPAVPPEVIREDARSPDLSRWPQTPTSTLYPHITCTSCGRDGTCEHRWSPSGPLLPAALFWGTTETLNWFVPGRALRDEQPCKQFLSMVNMSTDPLMASTFRAAAVQ